MNDSTTKQEIVDKITSATNILVTVSDSPSVDALSAALGLAISLNNLDKHATAIFSGVVPPAITFLDPSKTFETTTDSLRDFIIALDKEKADHLRYKVEGDSVKIFITPYRTTISQADLTFSQGDYNVELVIALGVDDQQHLDKALEAHGRILHDATVVSVSANGQDSKLGSINWHENNVSSLSEMATSLTEALSSSKKLLDKQISTAYLTGIVAETERFSNANTTSQSMTTAAKLMAAGADQQLIAAKLEESHTISPSTVLQVATKAEVVPVAADEPSLTALENAVQGLIVDHKPKTLEELSQEIKTQEVKDLASTYPLVDQLPAIEATPVAPIEPMVAPVAVEAPIAVAPELVVPEPVATPAPEMPLITTVVDTTPQIDTQADPFVSRSYVSEPMTQNLINGAMANEAAVPDVDIFAEPPIGEATSPENLANPDAALAAVHAAFEETVAPEPTVSLPMPPPLPDFSQLVPPASPNDVHPAYAFDPTAPVEVAPPVAPPADASQFRIPGQ